jgi:DsbC/DsbD-like thiol-disulfide interchange protein
VNSNKPKDEYLIPLAITWKSLGALEGGQLMFPKPETIKVAGEDTLVFTGNIDVTASFKVSDKAPGGPGIATGTLRYQACNDKACFPPKNIDFNVPYQVQ